MTATKLCECGCGQTTRPAVSNLAGRGMTKGQPQRFIAGHARMIGVTKVDRGHDTLCHIGPWEPEDNGYCRTQVNGVRVLAHRYFYEQRHGPIPDALELDHLCRQRACCNPDHLEPVTPGENRRRGDQGKLTADQVRAIRVDPRRRAEIAHEYGISEWHVSAIRVRRRNADVED